jgi:hypothetical protein
MSGISSPYVRRLIERASDPAASGSIRVYYNTSTGKVRISNGSAWADVGGGGPKVYRAILNQSGTSAPVATVLENSLGGTIVCSRSGAGVYRATLSNAFTVGKTFIIPGNHTTDAGDPISIAQLSASIIQVNTGGADDILNSLCLEISVYP